MLVPDKLATAALANIALEIAELAIAVVLPTEVTGPVKLAFVVTVAALPEIDPVALPILGVVNTGLIKSALRLSAVC